MGLVSPYDTNVSVSLSFTTEGYWTGGQYSGTPASFQEFPSGTYTVLAADEWGKVVLSYFTVAGTGTTFTTTSTSSAVNSTGQWSEGAVAKLVFNSSKVLSYVRPAYTYSFSIVQDPFAANIANALINVTETQSVSGNWTTGYEVTYSGVVLNATVQFTAPSDYQLISFGANNLSNQTYSINYNSTQQHIIQIALSNSTVENLLSKFSPYYVNEVSGLVGNGSSAYYFSIGQVDGPEDVSGYVNAAMTAVGSATLGFNGGGGCYYSPTFCYSVPWNSTTVSTTSSTSSSSSSISTTSLPSPSAG